VAIPPEARSIYERDMKRAREALAVSDVDETKRLLDRYRLTWGNQWSDLRDATWYELDSKCARHLFSVRGRALLWNPDSSSFVYWEDGQLRMVEVDSGREVTMVTAPNWVAELNWDPKKETVSEPMDRIKRPSGGRVESRVVARSRDRSREAIVRIL
jgi:hypothetical protein